MTTGAVAIVTGGGTAGHVLPALAIAEAVVAQGHNRAAVHYVGSERGIESRLVPPTGFPMTLLPGRGIQRRLTPANLAAVVWRVPLVVAEQNAVPGAANRLLARFARASAVSFEGTPLPRAVVTGNPVRPEVSAISPERDREAARRSFGVGEGRYLLLVFGGSLGALRINRAVLGALPAWRGRSDLSVHHVVGARDWDTISAAVPEDLGALEYRAVRYEDDMPKALAAADLAVCRSGSGTCFELAAVGLPAVLVPSPHVTADQQTANARRLVEAGAARLVPDAELDGPRLAQEVGALLDDDAARASMAAAARAWARPEAAAHIARLALEQAGG
jgi:UDP-N-acetylglucosamine--N-acetylmuramyl-(pentapeptide) pyrophosphoryl-undecaprenol N-acetylglucosamine transferase